MGTGDFPIVTIPPATGPVIEPASPPSTHTANFCPCGRRVTHTTAVASAAAYGLGELGRGSLFAGNNVVDANVVLDAEPEESVMASGRKVVRHAQCAGCSRKLGWRYLEGKPEQER